VITRRPRVPLPVFVSIRRSLVLASSRPSLNTNADFDNRAVTHLGAASATLHPRFLANKASIVVNTADLIMPATGEGSRKALTKVPMSGSYVEAQRLRDWCSQHPL
jgi:hypothetical protein